MKLIIFLIIGVLYLINLPSVASENIELVNNPDIPTLVGYGKGCITVQFDESAGKINPQKNRSGVTLLGITSLDIIAEKYRITEIEPQFPGARPIVFEGRTIDLSRDYLIRFETDVNLDEILGAFRENENIIKSQPIGIHNFDIVPNDPEFGD